MDMRYADMILTFGWAIDLVLLLGICATFAKWVIEDW